MKVYIGYDEREHAAAEAARRSLRSVTNGAVEPQFLCLSKLVAHGLLSQRVIDERGTQDYDLMSNAPQSTRFAISRFLTPILCQQGYALFVDCDVLFRKDPREMLLDVTAHHAVNVVKHGNVFNTGLKMGGAVQQNYHRKNWSSVMLFNCDHHANRRLSLRDINERPGRDLHAFYWLHDDEIGELPSWWNWLVDVQKRPERVGIAHMTLGGPWISGWQGGSFDAEWLATK